MSTQRCNNWFTPIALCAALGAGAAFGQVITLAPAPLLSSNSSNVKPNLLFILDDSGSMDWDYVPDWINYNASGSVPTFCKKSDGKTGVICCRDASEGSQCQDLSGNDTPANTRGEVLFASSDFNGVYYNPTITYTPPKKADGSSYPSFSTYTAVPADGIYVSASSTTGVQNSYKINLTTKYPDLEYCKADLSECVRNDNYLLPNATYTTARKINVSQAGGATSSTAKFATGTPTAVTITSNNLIGPYYYVAIPGEYCTSKKLTTCSTTNVPTTTYPYAAIDRWCKADLSACQAIRTSTYSVPRYPTLKMSDNTIVPGKFKRVDIVSGGTYGNLWIDAAGTLYTSSGSGRSLVLDRSTRSDCTAAPNCTYAQEMTNFANWYAYYRSRMQMMKSALSLAFASVPNNKYRIGYFSINGNNLGDGTAGNAVFGLSTVTKSLTGTAPYRYSTRDFVDIALWDDTQKEYWYNTLFKANPGYGTPLRESLSYAGRLYANMVKGAADPVEESCQQNFTILSTDGYWNSGGGKRITGGTPSAPVTASMDDQDGALSRPYRDGNSTADTLADAAHFYYNTDLRKSAWGNCTSGATGHDVCTDDVPKTSADPNRFQHMVTFTIGLGIDGLMQYRSNYMYTPTAADLPDDYSAVSAESATTASSGTGTCIWQANGTTCTWPQPSADSQANIDDLWHAAVNGRGVYYSARNPSQLASGLAGALATVNAQLGSAAAATTSSPNVSRNYNAALSTTYTTVEWSGDVFMQTIDLNTGLLSSSKVWSAQPQLDSVTEPTRGIWMFSASQSSKLKPFAWGGGTETSGLTSADVAATCGPTNERACFTSPYINSLSQFCSAGTDCLSTTAKTSASGSNLVAYLRGNRTYEGDLTAGALYRTRKHVLGDIVNSEATFAQSSPFPWDEVTNPGYTAFASGNYNRAGSVYVGANDGMVHAFNAANGSERWAYVPSMVLPYMYKLADTNYSHQYYVDSTPVVGDADAGGWKTLLVGGLGGGGAGYYALDVTDPASPRGMWEFKRRTASCAASTTGAAGMYDDCDLGYSYGNPIITKYCTTWTGVTSWAPDGTTPLNGTCSAYTWAVLVTSGYNNVSPGDGKGYLYVLEAATGKILKKIGTGVGSTATPSNLGRLNVWANNGMQDNVATTAYAGDMLGNLWRFNLQTGTAYKLAAFGSSRPITAKPAVGYVGNNYRVIYVPTGRLLSNTAPYDDLNLTATQGFYAVWDKNDGTTTWTPPSNFVVAPVSCTSAGNSLGDCTASSATSVFNGTNGGWYFDFPGSGERGYTDPDVVFGVIVFTSGSPKGSACSPSGSGRIWALDAGSGGLVSGASKAASSVAYMPPRPVLVSIGGKIEIIEGSAAGTGASAISSSSGLQFSSSTSSWGGACIGGNCPQVPRHTLWRILPN